MNENNTKKSKRIRFNLKFFNVKDDEEDVLFVPVRTLSELRDHYNLDDLYRYFESGVLQRWLSCRELDEEARLIGEIDKGAKKSAQIKEVLSVLGIKDAEKIIDAFIFSDTLKNERRDFIDKYKVASLRIRETVGAYRKIINDLIERKEDFQSVKEGVGLLLRNYSAEFELDHIRFYELMIKECPLAIFAVLMNPGWRDLYIAQADENEENSHLARFFNNRLRRLISVTGVTATRFVLKIDEDEISNEHYLLKEEAGIKQISDYTRGEEMWQDEVSESKKVMVLWNSGVEVRPYHDRDRQYAPGTLNGKFEIMNGLEYRVKSNSSACVLYMEV